MKTFYLTLICIFFFLNTRAQSESSSFSKNYQSRESQAIQNILINCKNIGLSFHEVKKIVYFIENHLFDLIPQKGCYLNKKITKLPCDIEYDPSSNLIFIHLDQIISEDSKSKILKKSILYDTENPKSLIVITAKDSCDLKAEIDILNQLQHINGVIQLISTPLHTYKNLTIQEMIIPFYTKGSLDKLKKNDLSLEGIIRLAADLMRILKEIHAMNIIHDDIHLGNLILEENKDHTSKIKCNLVLIDWEKSSFMKDKYYLANKDIYFAAVSLYFLLHPENYNRKFYKKVDIFADFFEKPTNDCSDELILGEISKEISKRKKELGKKKPNNMTLEEKFEHIILQIMHPTCKTIADAAYWHNEFEKLLFEKDN